MGNRSRHRRGRQALRRTCVPSIVRADAGLMVWLMCVTVTPAWGQGPQLDLPEESGPAEAPQAEHREKLTQKEEKVRSEEHTSELQSRGHLVCRLLLEKNKPTVDCYRT